jgi:hypothetical protein
MNAIDTVRTFVIPSNIQKRSSRAGTILIDIVRDSNDFDRKCADPHARAGLRTVLLSLGELLIKDGFTTEAIATQLGVAQSTITEDHRNLSTNR